jgi:hypothetical protein
MPRRYFLIERWTFQRSTRAIDGESRLRWRYRLVPPVGFSVAPDRRQRETRQPEHHYCFTFNSPVGWGWGSSPAHTSSSSSIRSAPGISFASRAAIGRHFTAFTKVVTGRTA